MVLDGERFVYHILLQTDAHRAARRLTVRVNHHVLHTFKALHYLLSVSIQKYNRIRVIMVYYGEKSLKFNTQLKSIISPAVGFRIPMNIESYVHGKYIAQKIKGY